MRSILPMTLLLLLGTAGPVPPGPSSRREMLLRTEGSLDGKTLSDFDGDGLLDILVTSGRKYHLFLQRQEGFRPEPDQTGPFDPSAVIYDAGDVTGDGASEIVLLTPEGFSTLSLEEGRFPSRGASFIEEGSLFHRPTPTVLHERDFLQDLDGDGLEDLLLPVSLGVRVLRQVTPGKFERGEELRVPLGAAVNLGRDRLGAQVVSAFWLPEVHPGEYTGDGRIDLGVVVGEALWVFAADEEGTLSPTAERRIPIRAPKSGGGGGGGGGEKGIFQVDYQLPLAVKEINGDPFPDFITSHVGRGSTHIFLGSPTRKELRTPSQIVKVDGFTLLNSIQDLDGDGAGDLIIASVPKIGLWGALKIFITRSITVDARVYYNRGRRLFPLVPDYSREVEVSIVARKGHRVGFGTGLIATATGDLDGDGIKDLVLRTGEKRLGVFPGRKRAGFADRPSEEIRLVSGDAGEHQVVIPTTRDLNGDGRDDLLLYYRSWDRQGDRLSVVLSGRD